MLVYPEGRFIKMKAGAAITAGQLVAITGNETVAPAGAGSTAVIGVAIENAAQNENVTIVTEGIVQVIASGAISAGNKVAAANGGKVAAWSASEAGDSAKIVGVALTSTGSTGGPIKIGISNCSGFQN